MRLSKIEYIFFSLAILIICVFSLLFYFDFTSRSAMGQEHIVGSISFKKRIAQRKYSDQVVWDDIEQLTPVYNNDSIRTAEQSEAVVRLSDGTEITVNENSMIQLSFATNEIDIQFRGGSISAKRGSLAEESVRKLNIKTGETTVSMARSDVQISGGKDKGVKLVVNRGDATVASGGREQSVKENQKVIVTKGSKVITVYTLPLLPLFPKPDSVIVIPENAGTVAFSWETLKTEQDGMLELSDTETFARKITARKITAASISLTLPQGTYFWRLRAENKITGRIDISEGRKFTIVKLDSAALIAPDNGQVIRFGRNRPVVNFKWHGSEIVQEYRLEIAADPDMKTIVAARRTPEKAIAAEIPGEGTYYWRIISVTTASGTMSRVPSTVRMMKVKGNRIIEPPVPQFPPNDGSINATVLKEKGVIFSWLNVEDIQAYRIVISTRADFANVVFTGSSVTNFINIRRQLAPGTYYWRINGLLGAGRQTGLSSVLKFSVMEGMRINLTYPSESSQVVSSGYGREVKLSWEKTGMYGEYQVQVSGNKNFSRIEREEHVTGTAAVLSGLGPGKYYWRVLLKNNDGTTVMMSSPSSFVVLDTLSEPVIISPANRQVIDMDKLDELDLRWKRLDDANAYQFRLYRMDAKQMKLVTERLIHGNNYDMADINFPGEGEYLWSIQAFEMNRDGSKIMRKSPVSRSRFIIKAISAPKEIKIITPKVIYVE